MDIEFVVLIILFIFIILLIGMMYFFLKRIVERINKVSKEYYLDKVQVFDSLINEKEKKLNELNGEIEKKNKAVEEEKSEKEVVVAEKNVSSEYDLNIKKIDYQDETILQQMKAVEKKFSFDEEALIKEFIRKKVKSCDFTKYNELKKIKAKLSSEFCYELSTKSAKEQESYLRELFEGHPEIVDKYREKNKKVNIISFRPYLDKLVLEEDPFVYVYVSDEKKNYDYLSDNIVTIHDNKIYRGVMIKYKNKMYDFCIK